MREAARIRGGTLRRRPLPRRARPVASSPTSGSPRRRRPRAAARASRRTSRAASPRRRTSASWTRDGNAASLSASTGCGSGLFVPGTGIQLNNMLGEPDLNPPGRAARPGERLTSMMAPSFVLEGGRPRLVVGSAGSDPPARPPSCRSSSTCVDHGLSAGEAIEAPRVHLDGRTPPARGRHRPGGRRPPGGAGLRRRALGGGATSTSAAPQPLSARERRARGGRRPAPRRSGPGGRVTVVVRRAAPGDAAALVELARAVGAEEEGWLITDGEWRSPSEERRYLRTVRRHPHAAVFVAEDERRHRRPHLARARPAPGERAHRRPRADGRRRAPPTGDRPRADGGRRGLGARGRRHQARAARLPATTTPRSRSTSSSATSARATAAATTGAAASFVDAILMAKQVG